MTVTIRFHPQAWIRDYAVDVDPGIRDYAVDVDPEGETEWQVESVPDDIEDNDHDSDQLAFQPEAPEWVREWRGPFWVQIVRNA